MSRSNSYVALRKAVGSCRPLMYGASDVTLGSVVGWLLRLLCVDHAR